MWCPCSLHPVGHLHRRRIRSALCTGIMKSWCPTAERVPKTGLSAAHGFVASPIRPASLTLSTHAKRDCQPQSVQIVRGDHLLKHYLEADLFVEAT